jgi:succinyl-diaminopimelate desuccinylase
MEQIRDLLAKLVAFPSVTPHDMKCQEWMIQYLTNLGFSCVQLDCFPVSNFFASYGSTTGPLLVFAGHTDVVPLGDEKKWTSNPFDLIEKNGVAYGRGTADMKGSLACMLLMAERFIKTHPNPQGRLGFLITSGEEGDDYHCGTPYVMEQLTKEGIYLDYCVVGEPSSTHQVGDVIKVGRRGSLNATIRLNGVQGHVAYPHLANNPIHQLSPALLQLTTRQWDQGNDYFPPTSMQITYIHSGGHANNIIPGELVLHLNFRYSTEQNEERLKEEVHHLFAHYQLHPTIEWRLSGKPFLTQPGALVGACQKAILQHTGITTELSTSGGTSDGRFIAPYGVEVVELGPVNATIHQVNECVSLTDLVTLEAIYFSICHDLLA